MVGMTFVGMAKQEAKHQNSNIQSPSITNCSGPQNEYVQRKSTVLPFRPLMDPLVQDLNQASRKYLSYCEVAILVFSISTY